MLAFGLRKRQDLINRIHLEDIKRAAAKIRANFKKVWKVYRDWKQFKLVENFEP